MLTTVAEFCFANTVFEAHGHIPEIPIVEYTAMHVYWSQGAKLPNHS
jgi:hypothetical protein